VLGIADQFKIPVKYIGVGEQVHQLQVFNKEAFVNALFGDK
jgi:fused signal recognition particle receptor